MADWVQVQLGISGTRYYQLLVGLLERAEVEAAEPELVGQLRALRTAGPLVVDPRRDPDATARVAAPGPRPYEVRARLERFYCLAAEADVPELTRLATTIETWWPAVEACLRLRVTNARTEGYNRKIKQICEGRLRVPEPGLLRAP